MNPGVIVACPTSDEKLYARDRWLAAVRAFTYRGPMDVTMVDTTHWPWRLDGGPWNGEHSIFYDAWLEIVRRAKHWPYIMSIDSDVICPPTIIEACMAHMAPDVFAVAHALPFRGQSDGKNYCAAGLMLLQTHFVVAAFEDWKTHNYEYVEWLLAGEGGDGYAPRHGLRTVKIDELEIAHLSM